MNNEFWNGDCLELMHNIPDGSVDMILCDLPYGTTACSWDSVIPFDELWAHYRRLIKPNGAIVLTASQPFTTALIASNMKEFKYCWYWNKNRPTGFANAKKQPLRKVEEVIVFYKNLPTYNPQGIVYSPKVMKNSRSTGGRTVQGDHLGNNKGSMRKPGNEYVQEYTNYPSQVLEIKSDRWAFHPTQKPVALFEYLIKTYTNPGGLVLDNCAGSGTTAIACINTGRNYICIEKDEEYYKKAIERVKNHEVS